VSEFDYVRNAYGVPACIGRVVGVYGKMGIITADRGHYIGVTFDTEKPQIIRNVHPMDGVKYFDIVAKPRKVGRSSIRYQEYLKSECNETFSEWLGIEKKRKEDV